jgi:hypothetical protein
MFLNHRFALNCCEERHDMCSASWVFFGFGWRIINPLFIQSTIPLQQLLSLIGGTYRMHNSRSHTTKFVIVFDVFGLQPAQCTAYTSGRRSLRVSWMLLSCLISTTQIATYSWYFGASLSLMVFDISTTCFRGSIRISDVTNWRWIFPCANHFTRKHRIGLRNSNFDHVSMKPALFKWIIWRCERLSNPLEPIGPRAPPERVRHTMKSVLDDAISCEIYRYIIFLNLLSITNDILIIGSLQ